MCRLTVEKLNEISGKEAAPSAVKNTWTVLELYSAWKCVFTATNRGVDISEAPVCYFLL